MVVAWWSLHFSVARVELLIPRLGFTDEVKDFNFLIESKTTKRVVEATIQECVISFYFLNAGKYEYVADDAVLYKKGRRRVESEVDQFEKYWLSKPWSPPKISFEH